MPGEEVIDVTASSISNDRTLEVEREKMLWLKAGLFFLKHLKTQRSDAERSCSGENADGCM